MRFRENVVVALVVIAASVACDATDTGGVTSPMRDATVTMGTNFFTPSAVTIPVGGKVLWVYPGSVHNVNFGGVPNAPGGCGNFVVGDCLLQFNVAGRFFYNCTLHPGMDGVVSVE